MGTSGSRDHSARYAGALWLGGVAAIAGLLFAAGTATPAAALSAIVAAALSLAVGHYLARAASGNRAQAISGQPDTALGMLEPLIEAVPQPLILLDRAERVVALNAPARAMVPALRLGDPASIALRVPELVDAIRRCVDGGRNQSVEFTQRVPSPRWLMAHVAPVRVDGERIASRFVLTIHDLTPIRQVEEMRADFVANASHELRTPLASLSGFIETLQGPAKDDVAARERFLEIMRAQAARMARLIDDLLSLSRIELRAHVVPNLSVDAVAVVRQVIDSLQMLARERGVTVSLSGADSLTVIGDRDELTRLFENLIENAMKYGATGGRVEIGVKPGDAYAEVSVRDYGPGIAAEHLPRLTERFYRVDVGESRAQGGTGLGLALVKHILNRHRGRLTIESKQGAGAVFTVLLPMQAST